MDSSYISVVARIIKNFFLTLRTKGLIVLGLAIKNYFQIIVYKKFFPFSFIKKNIFNYKMFLDPKDKGISRTLILFGKRELDHREILLNVLKKNMRIFDIGANIGYYVLMQRKCIGKDAKIVAFEPLQENVSLLRKNLNLNNDRTTIVIKSGVSNKSGFKQFYPSSHSNLGSFNLDKQSNHQSEDKVRAKVYRLKHLFKKYYCPDLIRMDVEGHEIEILSDLTTFKIKKYPMICFETHISRYKKDLRMKNVLLKLFKIGYKIKYASSSSEYGTKLIANYGYNSINPLPIKTDDVKRNIYQNIDNNDAIELICEKGGLRTILLSTK
ncbi:MAG: hypothetical protein CMD49_04205 [Gammaproteobacteria bacterium]|nr:hypothetical protein [Gammaproteobacteria bacterium]